jgi:hypothetical protein
MVLLRKSTLNEPISINDPNRYGVNFIQTLPGDFFNRFEARDYALVYDNDEVFAYIREKTDSKK